MPCNSDYLDPNEKERAQHDHAESLKWIYENITLEEVPKIVDQSARSPFGNNVLGVDMVVLHCKVMNSLTEEQKDKIFNGDLRDKQRRKTINLYYEHEDRDKQKKKEEEDERRFALRVEIDDDLDELDMFHLRMVKNFIDNLEREEAE